MVVSPRWPSSLNGRMGTCRGRETRADLCSSSARPPAGLTDYEIRDINDEINKLMREKTHWERQIVSLGGANYKRTGAMLDEDGKEVPGTRGYK